MAGSELNAIAEGRDTESKEYFRQAVVECSKIKSKHEKKLAEDYISLLILPGFLDIHRQKIGIAELELGHILAMEQIINASNETRYRTYTYLAAAIISKKGASYDEYAEYMNSAIAIAKLPNSGCSKDLPDLYMRLALIDPAPATMKKSNVA